MHEKILIVDDEPDIRESLKEILEDEEYQISLAESAESAEKLVGEQSFDLVLLDIWMPGEDGLEFLKRYLSKHFARPVIMISGHGTIETAVDAIKHGAYDFIEKPLSLEKVLLTLRHALEMVHLREENLTLRQHARSMNELHGQSRAITQVRQHLERVAPLDSWVLITGAAGSGKEVAARYLHDHSSRAQGPFIDLKPATISSANIETELFGSKAHAGRLERAHGGTLFLDELLDMSLSIQSRLHSALEEGRFLRVGGDQPVQVDIRVVSSTSGDLRQAVDEGHFREDLYYLLNVVPIRIPPLAERIEDIPDLIEAFQGYYLERDGLPAKVFSPDALEVLANYSWPGNVRELQNLIERLMILTDGDVIEGEDAERGLGLDSRTVASNLAKEDYSGTLRNARERFERAFLEYHLNRQGGNIARTAEAVGVERTHLYRKLKGLGIAIKSGN